MFTRLPSCKITGAILVALVLFTLALANAPKAEANGEVHRTLPLCSVEDASSGPVPCVWVGFYQGNGEGRSFRVYKRLDPVTGDHAFNYISNSRAFELAGECDSNGPLYCRSGS